VSYDAFAQTRDMARIREIEDGESVGIGLAGSELPRRRNRRTRSTESASASGEDDKTKGTAAGAGAAGKQQRVVGGGARATGRGWSDGMRAYFGFACVMALVLAIGKRVMRALSAA